MNELFKEEEEALRWKIFRAAKGDVRYNADKVCFRIRLSKLKHAQKEVH